MTFSIPTAALAAMLGSAVLCVALLQLRRVPGAPDGIGWWAGAFAVNTARFALIPMRGLLGADAVVFGSEALQAVAAVLLLAGSLLFVGRGARAGLVSIACAGVVAWSAWTTFVVPHFLLRTGPLYGLSGVTMLYTAWLFWRGLPSGPGAQAPRFRSVAVVFALWGVHKFDYPLLRPVEWFAPWGFMLAQLFSLLAAVGLLLAVLRWHEHRAASLLLDRERVTRALRESETRFRDFADVAADWFWEMDEHLRFTYLSARHEESTGVPVERIVGQERRPLFTEHAIGAPELEAVEACMRRREPYDGLEFDWRRPDGRVIRISSSAKPMFDEAGRFLGYRGVGRDVTEQHRAQHDMLESESRYRALFDTSPDAILVHRAWRIIEVNSRAVELFGAGDASDLIGRDLGELIAPAFVAQARERTRITTARGQNAPARMTLRRLDGSDVEVEAIGKGIGGGDPPLIQSVFRDLSARLAAERSLETLSEAVEQSPVSVLVTDRTGRIEYVNAAFESFTGIEPEAALGTHLATWLETVQSAAEAEEMLEAVRTGRPWRGEVLSERDGERSWSQVRIAPVRSADGTIDHHVVISLDISQQKEQEALIRRQAQIDALTGLPNRMLALDRLRQAIRSAARESTRVALMFIDLDDFKKVNDTLGHEFGDRLLVEVAGRIRGCVREGDTVARYGGDECLVVLGGMVGTLAAETVAGKILQALAAPVLLDETELTVTASIGIALYPDDGEEPQTLLRHADTAMYQSKGDGGNVCRFFRSTMNATLRRRLDVERALRRALDDGELHLLYQPVFSIADRRVVGAEALLRWRSATLGDVGPDEFIPVAEQTGLVVPIGAWVLEQACREAHRWHVAVGHRIRISVNVSPRQFRSGHLVEDIARLIAEHELPAGVLELEITEGLLMVESLETGADLEALRALGVRITMDDFGTGYSSLSQLKRYQFDALKIDRSFVRDVPDDPGDAALVKATLAMARGLDVEVVGEGVETSAQLRFLEEHGCEYVQGFMLGRPAPAVDLLARLRSGLQDA